MATKKVKVKVKKRKLKVRSIFITLSVLVLISLIVVHLINLPVTNIYIKGNNILSDKEIIKIAELKNGITDSTQRYNGDKGEKYIIHDKDILFSWSGIRPVN